MLYLGSVRVPDDAKVGTAIFKVRLPAGSSFESTETSIEVELVR